MYVRIQTHALCPECDGCDQDHHVTPFSDRKKKILRPWREFGVVWIIVGDGFCIIFLLHTTLLGYLVLTVVAILFL